MDPEVFQNDAKAQGREEGYRPSATVLGRGIMKQSVGDSDREVRRGNEPHLASSVCLVSFLKSGGFISWKTIKNKKGLNPFSQGFA